MLLALVAVLLLLLVVLPLIGIALWAVISAAFVGLIIGGLARLILPGAQPIGIAATILLGWIGSMFGGFLGYHVIGTGYFLTVLLEIGVSAVLIAAYSGAARNQLTSGGRLSRR
jgi:uncharacterized membrane protein YeaQ/YmgE (transglycosylase-associated protein family)